MKPIDFSDVRIGDTIMERHSAKGLTHTRTGVVGAKTPKRLYTDQNETIGWSGPQWPIWKEHQLFLISRPVPVLPTVAPAVIENVRLEDSEEADYAILADDGWHCFTHSGIHFLAQEKDIISWDDAE